MQSGAIFFSGNINFCAGIQQNARCLNVSPNRDDVKRCCSEQSFLIRVFKFRVNSCKFDELSIANFPQNFFKLRIHVPLT